MSFAAVLIITALVVLVFQPAIRRWPAVFYVIALVLDTLLFVSTELSLPHFIDTMLILTMRRGMLPLALFVIVMFTGVFEKGTKIRGWLQPIRGYLSIIACLTVAGHVVTYFLPYLSNLLGGWLPVSVAASTLIGLALTVLVVLLGVTSLNFIKRRMSLASWHRLQKLAYLFYALTYIHIALFVGVAVFNNSSHGTMTSTLSTFIAYSAVFLLYAILRFSRTIEMDTKQKTIEAK